MKSRLLLILLLLVSTVSVHAKLQTQEIEYQVGENHFTGYLAYDDSFSGDRPGVLVLHEWWGHVPYARKRAEMLAGLGYTAFALDMYGTGKTADHPETAKKFMEAVISNMPDAMQRFNTALDILRTHFTVNNKKIAAIGYCFGGAFALNMARSGADLKGVVSVHGSLATQSPAQKGQVKANILVLTGAADPFVPQEQIDSFEKEMQAADVRYQVVSYPDAKHAFSNPGADVFGKKFGIPLEYNKAADEDSWLRMSEFFHAIFR